MADENMHRIARAEVARGLEPLLARMWRFALALTRDPTEAEDLVQATCLKALEKADRFRPGTALDRWCMTLMANLFRDRRRRSARAPFAAVEPPDAADPSPDPEACAAHADVLRAIDALPEGQRAVAVLVWGEGMTCAEAAGMLGIPLGTVLSRMHAARAKLRARLA